MIYTFDALEQHRSIKPFMNDAYSNLPLCPGIISTFVSTILDPNSIVGNTFTLDQYSNKIKNSRHCSNSNRNITLGNSSQVNTHTKLDTNLGTDLGPDLGLNNNLNITTHNNKSYVVADRSVDEHTGHHTGHCPILGLELGELLLAKLILSNNTDTYRIPFINKLNTEPPIYFSILGYRS